jgi:hypothetical protein
MGERVMDCRVGPGQTVSLIPGMGVWWHFVQAPFPASPHALGLTDPVLGANCYLKVMVPKKH